MPRVQIQTNQPVTANLLSTDADIAPSQFGGDQMKFRLSIGELYVSESVGNILLGQIAGEQIAAGESVTIAKREVQNGNRKAIRWTIARAAAAAPPPPPLPPAAAAVGAGVAVPAATIERVASAAPAWSAMLAAEAIAVVDAYAVVLKDSAKHGGLVKGEDVRSIFLSAYINASKRAA